MPGGNPAWKKGVSGNAKGRPIGAADKNFNVIERLKADGYDLIGAFLHLAKENEVKRDEEGIPIQSKWNEMQVQRSDWAKGKILERLSPILKSIEYKADDAQHNEVIENLKIVMNGLAEKFKRDY